MIQCVKCQKGRLAGCLRRRAMQGAGVIVRSEKTLEVYREAGCCEWAANCGASRETRTASLWTKSRAMLEAPGSICRRIC